MKLSLSAAAALVLLVAPLASTRLAAPSSVAGAHASEGASYAVAHAPDGPASSDETPRTRSSGEAVPREGIPGKSTSHAAEPADLAPPRWSPGSGHADARAAFSLRVGRHRVPLRVLGMPVEPGSSVEIEGLDAPGALSARASGGELQATGRGRWTWRAPRAGFHTVEVASGSLGDTIRVTFLVMREATEIRDGALGGYAIGTYRPRPTSMSASYEPPSGFVEVRPEDYDILVAPNFRLGQFLCKQPGDPRFMLVSPDLLLKLEALLARVNEAGYETPSLTVMSGFRTPAYNRAIGNTTDFSRHLWGDAADVFVDADGDGTMDDVDRDGRVSLADARWLAARMDEIMAEPGHGLRPGGMSVYRPNAAHGPFVHVDARGHRSRW